MFDGTLSLIFEKLKVRNNAYKMIPLLYKNVNTVGKSQEGCYQLRAVSLRREPVRVSEQLNFTHFCILCFFFFTSGTRPVLFGFFFYQLQKFVILTSSV